MSCNVQGTCVKNNMGAVMCKEWCERSSVKGAVLEEHREKSDVGGTTREELHGRSSAQIIIWKEQCKEQQHKKSGKAKGVATCED